MKLIVTITLFLAVSFGYSQNTICIYKVKKNETLKVDDTASEVAKSANKLINRALGFVDQLEYVLIYNNKESTFKLKETLTGGSEKDFKLAKLAAVMTSHGKYYQNLSEDLTLRQFEVYGQEFLVNEPLNIDWETTNIKKTVGKYTYYKAINKCKSCSNSNITEVWYTPQIAIPFGPKGFGGLPGLIVEVKMKAVTLYLDKIVKNQIVKIKRPLTGKSVTLKEYEKIAKKLRPTR